RRLRKLIVPPRAPGLPGALPDLRPQAAGLPLTGAAPAPLATRFTPALHRPDDAATALARRGLSPLLHRRPAALVPYLAGGLGHAVCIHAQLDVIRMRAPAAVSGSSCHTN